MFPVVPLKRCGEEVEMLDGAVKPKDRLREKGKWNEEKM